MAVTTINPEAEIPARAVAALSDAQAALPQSLPQLLAKRNVLVDAANALIDPPNEQLDDAAIGYETVERAIRETPAETVDDVVAKVALIAEFVREQGCPDVDDVEAVLAEARAVLIRACDPMHSEKVDRTDAHWSLVASKAVEIPPSPALPAGWPSAETLAWHRTALEIGVAGATARPSARIREISVDTLLRTPSLDACDRYRKFLCIAEAAFPEDKLSDAEMASWSIDTSLPLERRLVGSLLLDLRLDALRETAERGAQSASPQPFGGPQGDGYASSPPLPDASTPLAQAVALRDRLRTEAQAYEDEHDASAPEELRDRVAAAEFAVYRAPAISAAEIVWKLGEHLMEDGEGYTHAEAVAELENAHGLEAAALAGVYRDLERLAGLDSGATGPAAVSQRWDRAQLLAAE